MSKRKKKKVRKLICFFIISCIGVYLLFYCSLNIKLIGDKEVYININDKYFENGYEASFWGQKINDVKVHSDVDVTQINDYSILYEVNFGGINKKVTRIVHVVDKEKPVLTLKGDSVIYLNLHEEFVEPGYNALDNLDGDITSKVIVNSNYNPNEVGTYKVTYEVADTSKNRVSLERTIDVIDGSILTSSIKEFRLDGYFEKTTLKYDTTEYDYFKDTIFLGDSNTTFLYLHGKHISKEQTWGRNNLNIAQINNSQFTSYADGQNYYLKEALDKFAPKYLLVSPGISAALYMKKDVYLKELNNFIAFMRENYPNTKVAFVSIFPVNYGSIMLSHQKTINEYNYYLAETCYKNNIKFINFADTVKGSDGYANTIYYECTDDLNCNFHLNTEGKNKYIDYIKHLNLGGM